MDNPEKLATQGTQDEEKQKHNMSPPTNNWTVKTNRTSF
jgi:hypothetical protein